GGTKFIGRKVVEILLTRGHMVTLFHRGQHEEQVDPQVEHIHGDKAHLRDLQDTLRQRRFEAVIDMVADNGDDAQQSIDIFRGQIRQAVYLSSQNVYSPWGAVHNLPYEELAIPFPEESPLRQVWFLHKGRADHYEKILMEQAVMQAHQDGDFPATVLRLPAVYGPRDYQVREYPFIKRIQDKRRFLVLGRGANWLWQRGYVDDVALAVVQAAEQPEQAAGQIFNVGHRQVWTIEGLARQLARIMNWEWEIHAVPDEILAPQALFYPKLPHIVADTDKIRRLLGWQETVSQEEALARTVEWHVAHPPDHEHLPYSFDYDLEEEILNDYQAMIEAKKREEAQLEALSTER
ncbi:MAG: NAD-dependent epimerase/dehydratase family protein, partial [Nevskia sp.]|nr:NAD-dependent epimerase/dehydratase family protein [Nevskia sp.]